MKRPNRREFLVQSAGALTAVALVPETVPALPARKDQALGIAVVGAGRQGRAIIDELRKIGAVAVAAVCDAIPGRVDTGIERAPGAAGFADHRALLDARTDVEAIVIATPTHLHRTIVEDCLSAGRHVYCEAPLASTIEDCQGIADAARASNTVFQVGLQGRSNPLYRRTWTLFRAGSLRDIVSLYAQHHRKTSWRFPGSTPELETAANWRLDPEHSIGLAGELGPHQFDVVNWFLDRHPIRIDGTGSIRLHDDGRTLHDTIEVRVFYEEGMVLDYRASLATSFGGVHEIIHGANASVRLAWDNGWLFKEADAPTEGWEVYATRQQFHSEEGIALVADATRLAAQGRLQEGIGLEHPPLYYALADFVRSIAEGTPVACSADEGMRATALGILAHRAIRTGTSVDVPPPQAPVRPPPPPPA
ncbi:MAG: Gfo/Idh/MocA family protein [Longimicrobiales bacterium]